MTPTASARARLILHRLVTARTFADFEQAAMALGLPPFGAIPPAEWLRRLRWRVTMVTALLVTVEYRAGRVRLYGAN